MTRLCFSVVFRCGLIVTLSGLVVSASPPIRISNSQAEEGELAEEEETSENSSQDRELLLPPGIVPPQSSGLRDPRLEQMIHDAIDGKQTPGESGMSSQMLDLLRSQSVLRGSVLDREPDEIAGGPSETLRARGSKTGRDASLSNEKQENQAVAAELLLRAARRLSKIGVLDESRKQLVNRMRQEAVRLLSSDRYAGDGKPLSSKTRLLPGGSTLPVRPTPNDDTPHENRYRTDSR